MAKNLISNEFSVPINGEKRAKIDIHAGDGNLAIDGLGHGEAVLASGTLEYSESQGAPIRHLEVKNGEVNLSVQGNKDVRPRFRLPWAACNAATNWSIHLNSDISSDITVRSNGGNLKLDFSPMRVTHLLAYTGGGNIEIILSNKDANLTVNAKAGAGNVSVCIPSGLAVRVHASTGLGKVIMDPNIIQADKSTYQSPDYELSSMKMDITATSGAGNVIVTIV